MLYLSAKNNAFVLSLFDNKSRLQPSIGFFVRSYWQIEKLTWILMMLFF